MRLELVLGVAGTAVLATVTAFAWAPPEEVMRRLLKRALRRGAVDPGAAQQRAERLLDSIGMASAMALFVCAFLTGWMVVRWLAR